MNEIMTEKAPLSIGPYSQGIRDGNHIYVSGQGPVGPESDDIVGANERKQTNRAPENIRAVLMAADCSLNDVVKATIFVQDMDDYDAINEVYAEQMSAPDPARSAVEVATLPIDIDVEIEVIASIREA